MKELTKRDDYTMFIYDSIPEFPKKVTRGDLIALSDLFFGEGNYYIHTLSDAIERLKRDGQIYLPERGCYARPTDMRQLAHSFRRHIKPLTRRSLLLSEEVKAERLRRQLRDTLRRQKEMLGTTNAPKLGRPKKYDPSTMMRAWEHTPLEGMPKALAQSIVKRRTAPTNKSVDKSVDTSANKTAPRGLHKNKRSQNKTKEK